MARKKRKASNPSTGSEEHKPRNSSRSLVNRLVILLAIVLVLVLCRAMYKSSAADPIVVRIHTTLNQASESYPIPSIRGRIAEINNRLKSGEYEFVLTEDVYPAIARADYQGKNPGIMYVLPSVRHLAAWASDETFTDYVVEVTIHEDYHIREHGHGEYPGPDEHRRTEGETWWFMCREVLSLMRQHGRLSDLPSNDSVHYALICYDLAAGNPETNVWVTFTRYISRQMSETELRSVLFPSPSQPTGSTGR